MSRKYKGTGEIGRRAALSEAGPYFYLKLPVGEVHLFGCLMEGFTHLAWVTTVNPKKGVLGVYPTPDTKELIRNILASLPCSLTILGEK